MNGRPVADTDGASTELTRSVHRGGRPEFYADTRYFRPQPQPTVRQDQ